jgi:hypothetical protein
VNLAVTVGLVTWLSEQSRWDSCRAAQFQPPRAQSPHPHSCIAPSSNPATPRYAREMSLHALELLQLLTLHPAPRAAVLAPSLAPRRTGMAVLLHAAGTGHAGPPFYGLADPEVGCRGAALRAGSSRASQHPTDTALPSFLPK